MAEGIVVAGATCGIGTAGLSSSAGPLGTAAVGSAGTTSAGGVTSADERGTALIVPVGEDAAAGVVVGAAAGCSAGCCDGCSAGGPATSCIGCACAAEEGTGSGDGAGGAGASAAALVCICGTCSAICEVLTSVGMTMVGSSGAATVVAAVRARERVHRRPFTVVTNSCGEAMQATNSSRKRQQGLKRRNREKEIRALWAL